MSVGEGVRVRVRIRVTTLTLTLVRFLDKVVGPNLNPNPSQNP